MSVANGQRLMSHPVTSLKLAPRVHLSSIGRRAQSVRLRFSTDAPPSKRWEPVKLSGPGYEAHDIAIEEPLGISSAGSKFTSFRAFIERLISAWMGPTIHIQTLIQTQFILSENQVKFNSIHHLNCRNSIKSFDWTFHKLPVT